MTTPIAALIISLILSICPTQLLADQSTDTPNNFTRQEAVLLQQLLEQKQQSNQELLQAENAKLQNQLANTNKQIDDRLLQTSHAVDRFSLIIAIIATLITVILFALSIFGYFSVVAKVKEQAQKATEDWVTENETKLRKEIEQLQEEAKKAISDVEKSAAVTIEKIKLQGKYVTEEAQSFTDVLAQAQQSITSGEELDPATKTTLQESSSTTDNTPEDNTFDGWNRRAFAAWSNDQWQKAADSWQQAADASNRQKAQSLFNKGVSLRKLEKPEEEIKAYQQVIDMCAGSDELALKELVANALVNKGLALGELKKPEEEIKACQQVIDMFAGSDELALKEPVAKALVNKGITLGELEKPEEAINAYQQVIDMFAGSDKLALKELVADAFNGWSFVELMRSKKLWLDQPDASKQALENARSKITKATKKPSTANGIHLGNLSYIQWLQKELTTSEKTMKQALGAKEHGGESLYKGTLEDIELYPIEPDTGFKTMLERVWQEIKDDK